MAYHTHSITASELKLAVLDPQWRAGWLAGQRPSTRTFPPPGTPSGLAVRFHREAETLVAWLTAPDSLARAARIESAAELMEQQWVASLQALTDRLFAEGRAEEASLFTDRMRSFCGRLIDIRRATPAFENWQDVFVAAELDLGGVSVPVGDRSVLIRARVDAVRFRPDRRLEVVDYKLSQGMHQKADLVQLAIYAHVLSLWRPGCEFGGTLEYYLPRLSEVQVSRSDLADIFVGLVAPVLGEMFAPRRPARAPVTDVQPSTDAAALGSRAVAALRSFGLQVDVQRVIEGPQVIRLQLTPGPGIKAASLANRAEDLQVALSLPEPPLIKAGQGSVIVDLPRSQPRPCLLKDALAGPFPSALRSPVSFPVGIGIDGELVVADFAESSTSHVLVAGSTGSGKSEWLKALIAGVLSHSGPDLVQVALIDPKILTFASIAGSPYLWRPVATTLSEAMEVLRAALAEMDERYQVLKTDGFVNLAERIRGGRTDIPFLLLIFDEFADLVLAGREERREFETLVGRIAAKGRAAGIHLVLATQRPDRQVVTGLIKANLPARVCLKVTNATNSQIVLGEAGAESLFGSGDLLYDFNRGSRRGQGLYISQADFVDALRSEPPVLRPAG